MLLDKKNLISPITGGKMTLKWEFEKVEFRKEKFNVWYPYYECVDTGHRFTTTETDGVWCQQMRQQYCRKYGIPYTDEIIALRERYGLPAQKMSLILGFGENQWRKYEQGEIPSVSNGRMIRSAMNPEVMMVFVKSAREVLTEREFDVVKAKVQSVISRSEDRLFEEYETGRVFEYGRGAENGFAPLSLRRLKAVMLYFIRNCKDVYNTKMNKLLFYLDMLAYRERGMAMTGLAYDAIQFGPVPVRWDRVYSMQDGIRQEMVTFDSGAAGTLLVSDEEPDMSLFNEEEKLWLELVANRFRDVNATTISAISHEEDAWKNATREHRLVDFNDAFTVKALTASR